ncbi:MAG: L-threonine 3-dehydrogenase [Deltaproteobacteria bacterium]|nr:L-threonine 3-dehydrogenase [Deltaproteobacteria bacterium]
MADTMKCIVKARPEPDGLEMQERSIPRPSHGKVLIKVQTAAICGTDLHIFNWDHWSRERVHVPRIIGHEFAGKVVETGPDVEHLKVGDYVTGEGHLTCGFCRNCRMGDGHVCENWRGIGYDVDGCFAEYIVHPELNTWLNDETLPPHVAAIQDPLGNAIHTVFAADCIGNDVAVFGLGPVGLLAVAVLKAIGAARIFAIDWDNHYRMDIAGRLGAHHVIAASEKNAVDYVMERTSGKGLDVVLEVSGSPEALQDGLRCLRMAGDLVLIGTSNKTVSLDITNDVVFRAINIHGITGRRLWHTWYKMKGLLASGNLEVEPIITHRLPFDDFHKGFELMQAARCGKVVLEL